MFVLGGVLVAFAVPGLMSAFSDNRAPRVSGVVLLIGVGMIAYTTQQRPGGYTFETAPDVLLRVIARYIG